MPLESAPEPNAEIEQCESCDDYAQRREQLENQGYEYDGFIGIADLDDELEVYRAQKIFSYIVLPQFMDSEKSDEFVEIWVPFDNKDF